MYENIFNEVGTVLKLGVDVTVYDWKTVVANTIKTPANWHLSF